MTSILYIPFIPLLIAFLLLFIKNKRLFPLISMALSILIFILAFTGSIYVFTTGKVIYGFNNYLVFNELASILVPYIAILGLVIRKYSVKYMWDESGYKRFFIQLNFIFSAIYLLIMSNNLIVLAIAWQLMSISLYLLVTFNIGSSSAIRNGNWTMFIHKSADIVFLVAVVMTYKTFGSFDLNELKTIWLSMLNSQTEQFNIFLIAFLFLIAAMMKSAIIPFHIWLPYTSEAPTPVSALMHAGIVNVGGILLNKLAYLLVLTPSVLNIAFVMGLITAILASLIMLVIPDIKRSLGYSTVGQMGYMIMEIGLGAFSLAIYHLMVHGIFKATLFLESGGIIKYARHEPNIPKRLSYEIFWEKNTHHKSSNIFYYVAFFTILPVVIYIGIKFLLDEEFFKFNAAIVILAFAWLTGTQLFLSFFKVAKTESIKVIATLISSFILVLFTYEFLGLALEHFLYSKDAVLFYKAAAFNTTINTTFIVLLLIMLVGWFFIYRQHFNTKSSNTPKRLEWVLYRFLLKEAYFVDFFKKYFHF